MIDTGITRKVDELGRFVIPSELKRIYNLEKTKKLSIYLVNNDIYLIPYGAKPREVISIVRPLDALGRIVLPKELRNYLEIIDNETYLEVYTTKESIVLKKKITSCVFCENKIGLSPYREKKICENCLCEIAKINEKRK